MRRSILTHAVRKPVAIAPGGGAGRDLRAWKAATFPRRTRWGRRCPASTIPAPDVQQFVPILYPPGTPQPTAAEVQRESFVAKGYGPIHDRPGPIRHPVALSFTATASR